MGGMDFEARKRLTKLLILVSISGLSVITVFFLLSRRNSNQSVKDFRPTSKLAYARGISFTEYQGEKKLFAVSIDSFSIEPARIGPFAIAPLRVAYFNNVNVDLYLHTMGPREDELTTHKKSEEWLPDFQNPIANIRRNLPAQLPRIRGFKLKGLSLNLWKNGERIFRVSSDTADFDQRTQDLTFVGHAMIDSGENGSLLSYRIGWNYSTRLFSAAGPYILKKNGQKREGTGIETDYLFRRINFHPAKG